MYSRSVKVKELPGLTILGTPVRAPAATPP